MKERVIDKAGLFAVQTPKGHGPFFECLTLLAAAASAANERRDVSEPDARRGSADRVNTPRTAASLAAAT